MNLTMFSTKPQIPTCQIMSITIVIATQQIQDLLGEFHYSRRSMMNTPNSQTQPDPENHNNSTAAAINTFDGNIVIMVLSVLLCALIFSLGLNSIIKCVLRCSGSLRSESGTDNTSIRLANKGVKRKALKTFPIINYSVNSKLPGLDSECVVCLSDFASGDRLRILPKCNHGFHVRCIDKWLSSHSSCPKCRHCLIETCQKIVGCSQASSSEPAQSRQETIVSITPVGPEGFIHSYRF